MVLTKDKLLEVKPTTNLPQEAQRLHLNAGDGNPVRLTLI